MVKKQEKLDKEVEPLIKKGVATGKRKRKQQGYKRVTHNDRIAIIYDNQMHKMQIKELMEKHQVNYNTVRHIIQQYCNYGRTNIRNFKRNTRVNRKNANKDEEELASKQGHNQSDANDCLSPRKVGRTSWAGHHEMQAKH